MAWYEVLLLVAGALIVMEGALKVIRPRFEFRGMSLPCGFGLSFPGVPIIAYAIGKSWYLTA
ncbi:MAG: hypothetical protein NTU41_09505 [Chloroflexi bacterium]|nr:hypothetical protein [Chloroflexota bacterium]